jgi:hypothetical protein
MRQKWLLLGLFAFLAIRCVALSMDRQALLILDDNMDRLIHDQSIKVPGSNNAHFVGNPRDNILTIEEFNDKVMDRFCAPTKY